jgi:hypothetical protein
LELVDDCCDSQRRKIQVPFRDNVTS